MASINYKCPDCGKIMTSAYQKCSNCGCPPSFFTKIEPTDSTEKAEQLPYYVNPSAETVGGTIATVLLDIHVVVGVLAIIVSIAIMSESEFGSLLGIIPLVLGIVILIFGIVIWAIIRQLVNISRSLYNINDALRRGNK